MSSRFKYLQGAVLVSGALAFTGAQFPIQREKQPAPAVVALSSAHAAEPDSGIGHPAKGAIATATQHAIDALSAAVRPLSSPAALEDAFRSYFAFKAAHPSEVRNPYLYFVDYGLPSTERRGYVFDMGALRILEGPFTVAHGRGSSASKYGVPMRFSNEIGSAASSLGLYVTENAYQFLGKSAGRVYRSIGLRLVGVSGDYNDKAFSRRVVAHGAPYVTPAKAGRSEGCPAMEQERARRLLPKIAQGGLVFLFAPDSDWLAHDAWLTTSSAE